MAKAFAGKETEAEERAEHEMIRKHGVRAAMRMKKRKRTRSKRRK